MQTLPKTIDVEKHLSKEALMFVTTPKSIFRLPVRLTPYEYFALASFALESSSSMLEGFQNRLEELIPAMDLQILDFAKQYTLDAITEWSFKDTSREYTFSKLSMPQAVVIVKMMQKTEISHDQQMVLEKIFKELVNYWFTPKYFQQQSIKID